MIACSKTAIGCAPTTFVALIKNVGTEVIPRLLASAFSLCTTLKYLPLSLAELVGVETHDRGELFLVVRRAPPAVLAPLVRIEIIVVLPESILVAGAVRCGVEQGLRLPRG